MGQEQKKKSDIKKIDKQEDIKAKNLVSKADKLKAEIDSLVDKIDDVLEENAEEFLKNYVQKSGE